MELIFTNSYIGVMKWQFLIVVTSTALAIYRRNLLYITFVIFAFPFYNHFRDYRTPDSRIRVTNFYINVRDKWNIELQQKHIDMVIEEIERGIDRGDGVIIFPESIFPLFLNQSESLMTLLEALSNEITIITGGLYIDGDNNPKNTTYIFKDGTFQIASKAVLVPFGEYNPLPSWLGDIINRVFFDGAPDYVSSLKVTDYTIDGVKYRNAYAMRGHLRNYIETNPKNYDTLYPN